tara:strand:+ start:1218 stop:1979 length:762 start_codon:yes stop_codon:yes gene_type:complete
MKIKIIHFFIAAGFLALPSAKAQTGFESKRAWLIGIGLSTNVPSGPWTDNFRENYSLSTSLGRKFANNIIISGEWSYLFGGEVDNRSDFLKAITTSNGQLLNGNGSYAQININQRGTYFNLQVEKLFFSPEKNQNSGWSLGAGAGYAWHWLNIDNVGNDSPQLIDDYVAGYDRMSRGFLATQSIGYMYLSNSKLINLKLSFEVNEIWSQDVRKYHYPTGEISNETNLNLLYSLKLKWYLPIYLGGKTEEYYYN